MDKRPDLYRNAVVAHIYVEGAADAIAFYETAFALSIEVSVMADAERCRSVSW